MQASKSLDLWIKFMKANRPLGAVHTIVAEIKFKVVGCITTLCDCWPTDPAEFRGENEHIFTQRLENALGLPPPCSLGCRGWQIHS